MPDTNTWSDADTAAAAQVVSAGINYASAASANRKGRKWANEMYDRQRADALADWHMQNEYNSPAAQMARLKAGGLNPNLVYGDGANTPSASIRSSDSSTFKPEAPRLDVSGAANSMLAAVSLRNTEAQTDNLKVQQRLLEQQILKEAATTQSIGSSTQRSNFDLEQIKAKAATDIEIQKANLQNLLSSNIKTGAETENLRSQNRKIEADIRFTNNTDSRQALLTNQSLLKGIQEIANMKQASESMKQTIKNQETQNAIAELDRAMKARGYTNHDRDYIKIGQEIARKLHVNTPQEFNRWTREMAKKLWNKTNTWMKQKVGVP